MGSGRHAVVFWLACRGQSFRCRQRECGQLLLVIKWKREFIHGSPKYASSLLGSHKRKKR